MFDEGVVFLGGALGERLEPVGVVGHTVLLGPLPHAARHGVGYGAVQPGAVVNHVDEFQIHIAGEVLVHLLAGEDILAEVFRRALCGGYHIEGLLLESLFYNLKS